MIMIFFFLIHMWILIPIIAFIILLYIFAFFAFSLFYSKIQYFEKKMIWVFCARTDIIPALFEVSKQNLSRHNEIFSEILNLRKKEFSLLWVSESLESFLELEEKIHHEINFIFQVCNKIPKLNKDKNFLYTRDIMISKSSDIGKEMKKYRKIIQIYNKSIQIKNYTVIWVLIPYRKKSVH